MYSFWQRARVCAHAHVQKKFRASEREKESANERKKSKGNWSKMLETRQLNGMKISFNMAR